MHASLWVWIELCSKVVWYQAKPVPVAQQMSQKSEPDFWSRFMAAVSGKYVVGLKAWVNRSINQSIYQSGFQSGLRWKTTASFITKDKLIEEKRKGDFFIAFKVNRAFLPIV